ncbi:MAG: hypothetical protein D6742_15445 [Cyanobacteria bacterium J069]|nr:MAG: hypothetical protein D6742_15445 [Cyanobacteria bacterium J069]
MVRLSKADGASSKKLIGQSHAGLSAVGNLRAGVSLPQQVTRLDFAEQVGDRPSRCVSRQRLYRYRCHQLKVGFVARPRRMAIAPAKSLIRIGIFSASPIAIPGRLIAAFSHHGSTKQITLLPTF